MPEYRKPPTKQELLDALVMRTHERDMLIKAGLRLKKVEDFYLGVLGFICDNSLVLGGEKETIALILKDASEVIPNFQYWLVTSCRFDCDVVPDGKISPRRQKLLDNKAALGRPQPLE